MIAAVDSAMPSIKPTASAEAPSTPTRYTGSSAWIISEEMSISIETRPSAQMPAGIRRSTEGTRAAALLGASVCWLMAAVPGISWGGSGSSAAG